MHAHQSKSVPLWLFKMAKRVDAWQTSEENRQKGGECLTFVS